MFQRKVQITLPSLGLGILHICGDTALVLRLLIATYIIHITQTNEPMLALATIIPMAPTLSPTTYSLHILLVPDNHLQGLRRILVDAHSQKRWASKYTCVDDSGHKSMYSHNGMSGTTQSVPDSLEEREYSLAIGRWIRLITNGSRVLFMHANKLIDKPR